MIIIIQCLIGSLLIGKSFFIKYLQDNYPGKDAQELYLDIHLTTRIVYTYIVNLGIICSYIAIFIIYRRRVQMIAE